MREGLQNGVSVTELTALAGKQTEDRKRRWDRGSESRQLMMNRWHSPVLQKYLKAICQTQDGDVAIDSSMWLNNILGSLSVWAWEVPELRQGNGFLVQVKYIYIYPSIYSVFLITIMQDLLRLPDLFSPGMLVRCVVSSLDITDRGKKTVKLSVNPKHVNKVLSAEALRPGMVSIWISQGGGACHAVS